MMRSLSGGVLLLALPVVLSMSWSQPAAGSMRCLTKRALALDEQNIRIAARNKAAAIAPTLHISDFCGFARFAYVELLSPSVPAPDGALVWWRMNCRRSASTQRGSWICDAPDRHRKLELHAVFGGAVRKIDVDIGDSMDVATARAVSLEAIALFEDPESELQQCNLPDAERSSRSWSEIRSDLRGEIDRPAVDMWIERTDSQPDGVRVRLFLTFTIDFPARCWSEWGEVIVT